MKEFTDFTKFTLERVPPLLRDLRDVLAFIVVLMLTSDHSDLRNTHRNNRRGFLSRLQGRPPLQHTPSHRDSRPHRDLVLRPRCLVPVDVRLRRNLESQQVGQGQSGNPRGNNRSNIGILSIIVIFQSPSTLAPLNEHNTPGQKQAKPFDRRQM